MFLERELEEARVSKYTVLICCGNENLSDRVRTGAAQEQTNVTYRERFTYCTLGCARTRLDLPSDASTHTLTLDWIAGRDPFRSDFVHQVNFSLVSD